MEEIQKETHKETKNTSALKRKKNMLKAYPAAPVIYLLGDPHDPLHRLTYGRTKNFRRRIYQYYLLFKCVEPIVYFYKQMEEKQVKDIESVLHKIFHKYKEPKNSEWLENISVDKAIRKINSTIELYND